jgi:hypothetical protein
MCRVPQLSLVPVIPTLDKDGAIHVSRLGVRIAISAIVTETAEVTAICYSQFRMPASSIAWKGRYDKYHQCGGTDWQPSVQPL